MKIRVMIVDGVVDTVLGDDEAMQSNLEVEIVDFDKNQDNIDSLNSYYEGNLHDLPFDFIHHE